MKRILLAFLSLTLLAVVAFTVLWLQEEAKNRLPPLGKIREEIETAVLHEVRDRVLAPPPLRLERSPEETSFLTRTGVVRWTNKARAENGLPPLLENEKLDLAARERVRDMFAHQYFAHVSPTGDDAGAAAGRAGYAFIMIGENLALGNFEDDEAIVQAWMESPGHRANILHPRYEELGVHVERGVFEGKSTWIGVQIFALPASACPQPDGALRAEIETNEGELDARYEELEAMRMELEGDRPRGHRDSDEYEARRATYNGKVEEYNNLVEITKGLVAQYNAQVGEFNACVNS